MKKLEWNPPNFEREERHYILIHYCCCLPEEARSDKTLLLNMLSTCDPTIVHELFDSIPDSLRYKNRKLAIIAIERCATNYTNAIVKSLPVDILGNQNVALAVLNKCSRNDVGEIFQQHLPERLRENRDIVMRALERSNMKDFLNIFRSLPQEFLRKHRSILMKRVSRKGIDKVDDSEGQSREEEKGSESCFYVGVRRQLRERRIAYQYGQLLGMLPVGAFMDKDTGRRSVSISFSNLRAIKPMLKELSDHLSDSRSVDKEVVLKLFDSCNDEEALDLFQLVPEMLKGDKDIANYVLRRSMGNSDNVTDVAKMALSACPSSEILSLYQSLSESLQESTDIVLVVLENIDSSDIIRFYKELPDPVKCNDKVAMQALASCGSRSVRRMYELLSQSQQNRPDVAMQAISFCESNHMLDLYLSMSESLLNNADVVLQVLLSCAAGDVLRVYSSLPKDLQESARHAVQAISHCSSGDVKALLYSFKPALQGDKKVGLSALHNCSVEDVFTIFDSLPALLRGDKDIAIQALSRCPKEETIMLYEQLEPTLRGEKAVLHAAMSNCRNIEEQRKLKGIATVAPLAGQVIEGFSGSPSIDGGFRRENFRMQDTLFKSIEIADSAAQPSLFVKRITQDVEFNATLGSEPEKYLQANPRSVMIKVLSKYRVGIQTCFEFYRRANMGSVKHTTFDQIRDEHGGVNLAMFRRMLRDFNLVRANRSRTASTSKARRREEERCPFVTLEEIDAVFRRHSKHLNRVSSVSQGKGLLTKTSFAAAFAQIAVTLLQQKPWCEVYAEDWQRVDAIFKRLDLNNRQHLRKRLRANGGFSSGDGILAGHLQPWFEIKAPPRPPTKGNSFPLRQSVEQPPTPPPGAKRITSHHVRGHYGESNTSYPKLKELPQRDIHSHSQWGFESPDELTDNDNFMQASSTAGQDPGTREMRSWTLDSLSLSYGIENEGLVIGSGRSRQTGINGSDTLWSIDRRNSSDSPRYTLGVPQRPAERDDKNRSLRGQSPREMRRQQRQRK